jgi:hypothetical protein
VGGWQLAPDSTHQDTGPRTFGSMFAAPRRYGPRGRQPPAKEHGHGGHATSPGVRIPLTRSWRAGRYRDSG